MEVKMSPSLAFRTTSSMSTAILHLFYLTQRLSVGDDGAQEKSGVLPSVCCLKIVLHGVFIRSFTEERLVVEGGLEQALPHRPYSPTFFQPASLFPLPGSFITHFLTCSPGSPLQS
jgi:hypothetical protein